MRVVLLLGIAACVPAPGFRGDRDGSVADADADALDDGDITTATWSTPEPLTQLNTASDEQCPFVSADGTELYFSSTRTAAMNMFRSTRTPGTTDWDMPALIASFPLMMDVTRPILSADGLTMYLTASSTGKFSIHKSTRPGTGGIWTTPALVTDLERPGSEWSIPGSLVGLLEKVMYLSQQRTDPFQIVTANYTANNGWVGITEQNELNSTAIDESPWVSSDETVAIITSNRTELNGRDLYMSTRPNASTTWSTPILIPSINEPGVTWDFCAVLDGNTLYFTSDRSGNRDIYRSTRSQ